MIKTSYGAPMFESKSFETWNNEFGQYEMAVEASSLGLKAGEKPYALLGSTTRLPAMSIRSHKTGKIRMFKLIQEAASGWYFVPVDGVGIPVLVKIYND